MCPFSGNGASSGYLRIGGIDTTKLKGETGQPVANCANTENHHIHHHGVGYVLIAGETSLHQGKAGLHEEHEETTEQHPQHIEAEGNITHLLGCWWFAVLRKCWCGECKGQRDSQQGHNKHPLLFINSFHLILLQFYFF